MLLSAVAYTQPDTTNRARRADQITKFFIGSWGPFDNWTQDSARQKYGILSDPDSTYRFVNIEDTLGMNSEFRGFWDYPHSPYPAKPDTVLGGRNGQFLDVLGIEPLQLFEAFNQAFYVRIEFERHTAHKTDSEYFGFFERDGLTGTNQKVAGATYPPYLASTFRHSDTAFNALVLGNTDSPGVFADTMWSQYLFDGPGKDGIEHAYIGRSAVALPFSRKMLMRIRVKVDQSVDDTSVNPPVLCIINRTERDISGSIRTSRIDTIRVDSRFKHINSDFDTIELRFFRDAAHKVDSTHHMQFSFSWTGDVRAIYDYMELLTAHIDTFDTIDPNVYENVGFIGYPQISTGDAGAFSAEDFLASNPIELGKIISRIKNQYMGRANYVRVGDEFPLGQGLPFKRLVKLLRDSTGGQLEIVCFTVDSGTGWFGKSLVNAHDFNFEGRRRGWVDSNYADPRMLFIDPYVIGTNIPLPKRSTFALTDTSSLRDWEKQFIPKDSTVGSERHATPYSRERYMKQTQLINYRDYLSANRKGRRWVERQNDSCRYALDWQAGAGMYASRDTNKSLSTRPYFLTYGGLRPPTGAEMKVTGHLGASCGSSGLLLYLLCNFDDGYVSADNGGIMDGFGVHDSTFYTNTVSIGGGSYVTGRLWTGFSERYDSVRDLIPVLKVYGSELLDAKYIGDWTASELPIMDTSTYSKLPFYFNSIFTYDDSLIRDTFVTAQGYNNPDTANRTFVHVSMWIDTVGGKSDTLLYITNMRTDDSYDTTAVMSTIDRRLITMKMKAPHIIEDVAFPQGAQLDNEKIWTPYVGTQAGDSLKLFLKAGDGILIRLADTTQGTMRQTRIAINYPKNGDDFNDHGRVVFNRPVPGVLDKTNSAKWSIPSSSRPYIVGIPDTTTAKMWQDSLLYRTVHSSRTGRWRQQNWTDQAAGGSTVSFDYMKQLPQIFSGRRNAQISTDSIAHNIVIKTEFEDSTTGGKIKFYDPFFVDSTTLQNKFGDSSKTTPFLPQTVDTSGALQGGHHERYGGIFFAQNYLRDTSDPKPMYAIDAYQTILPGGTIFNDAPTSYAQWGFLQWTKNDYIHEDDPTPWINDTIARKVNVVFMRDSAIYIARYKAHMAAFESGGGTDSGMCCNNQRKLYFEGLDSIGQNVYRVVYNSRDRIYTALGTKTGVNNADFVWKPEELLSEWYEPRFRYPALGRHSTQPIKYHFVYQDDGGSIQMARIDTNHVLETTELSNALSTDHGVPAIASTDMPWGPIDVVAWEEGNNIRVRAIANWYNTTPSERSDEVLFGDNTAHFPTLWMDSCYDCNVGNSKAKFWLAYQKDTVIFTPAPTTVTDIFAVKCEVQYGSTNRKPDIVVNGNPFSVSRLLTPASNANIRPCLSGMRVDTSGTTHVKLAYEALHGPSVGVQGINVANNINFGGWTNTHYITSFNSSNKFWKPSIEVTKLQKVDTGYIGRLNWYSIVHERNNGANIQHWAFDSATQRLTSHIFTNLQDPQIAVTPAKIDSHIYRVALSRGGSEPRWIIPGYTGTYKLAGNDALWGYHSVSEPDTSGMLYIQYGYGELGVEDENGLVEFDLKERDESEVIDSAHSTSYFMRSEPFVLPASSSLQYCPWVYVSSDSIFRSEFDTMKFVLDFYDTSGAFVCRIDSFDITDSVLTVSSELRQISIDRDSNQSGFVVFSRISGDLPDTGKVWNSIISESKLSVETAYKRSGRKYVGDTDNGIILTAAPNPFSDALTLNFTIPNSGEVTIEVFDALGNRVGLVSSARFYSSGSHNIDWNPSVIAKGVYTVKLTFGNFTQTVKAIYVE
jgi:hypothetical protein